MAGFNASSAVEPLDYDFNPFVDSKGTVPEPSAEQINDYRRAIMSIFQEMVPEGMDAEPTDNGTRSTTEMVRRVTEFLGTDRTEMQEKILHTLADVCSNTPSFDELSALPYRHQQAFAGWISGVFLLPSLPTPATT